MRRRSIWLATIGAAVALGLAVATAAALAPPAGTPDLARMTIQASDLAPGSTVVTDAYAKPPKSFSAEYVRNFATAKTPAGVALFGLDTQVLLGDTQTVATGFFALERVTYRSRVGRALLTKALESASGKNGVTLGNVHFGKFRQLALGSQAFLQPVVLTIKSATAGADFVVLRDGAVMETVTVVLADPRRSLSVANQLGKDVTAHITAVLAAIGSTGASGPTGPTGPTGTTGTTGTT